MASYTEVMYSSPVVDSPYSGVQVFLMSLVCTFIMLYTIRAWATGVDPIGEFFNGIQIAFAAAAAQMTVDLETDMPGPVSPPAPPAPPVLPPPATTRPPRTRFGVPQSTPYCWERPGYAQERDPLPVSRISDEERVAVREYLDRRPTWAQRQALRQKEREAAAARVEQWFVSARSEKAAPPPEPAKPYSHDEYLEALATFRTALFGSAGNPGIIPDPVRHEAPPGFLHTRLCDVGWPELRAFLPAPVYAISPATMPMTAGQAPTQPDYGCVGSRDVPTAGAWDPSPGFGDVSLGAGEPTRPDTTTPPPAPAGIPPEVPAPRPPPPPPVLPGPAPVVFPRMPLPTPAPVVPAPAPPPRVPVLVAPASGPVTPAPPPAHSNPPPPPAPRAPAPVRPASAALRRPPPPRRAPVAPRAPTSSPSSLADLITAPTDDNPLTGLSIPAALLSVGEWVHDVSEFAKATKEIADQSGLARAWRAATGPAEQKQNLALLERRFTWICDWATGANGRVDYAKFPLVERKRQKVKGAEFETMLSTLERGYDYATNVGPLLRVTKRAKALFD